MKNRKRRAKTAGITSEDFKFLVGTGLFSATPKEARSGLMSIMTPMRFKRGDRFITQGEKGDSFFVIQEGSCVVKFEKDGVITPVCRLKPRDLVGEMAVFTGERRMAHVDAETDMLVWCIKRHSFDRICGTYHEVRTYLTEMITNRLATQTKTADRAIGKYTIKDIIGKGGWSVVYRGVHTFLHLPVAIKMLKHDMAMDPDFSKRFQHEAKIIARLSHENIVRVYDIEHEYRTIFIVMEYLEGNSLRDVIKEGVHITFPRVMEILMQVCSGLKYAHAQQIIHQDIKPENIFIQQDGVAKILDFGLACKKGADEMEHEGTIHYMAPEQIEGDSVDERTDIYALGITSYELVTGCKPFNDLDPMRVMDRHLSDPIPDPRRLVPDLPDEFCHFIARCTAKDPGERYANIEQVIEALTPLAESTVVDLGTKRQEKMETLGLLMSYPDTRRMELNELLESFTKQLKDIGAKVRLATYGEV